MIRFIDLFAGVGGIRIGVTEALKEFGIQSKCVLSSEIDENACLTYNLNFNEKPSGDIRLITESEPFDLLLGGFPCQPCQSAALRCGAGRHNRNGNYQKCRP